MGINELQFHLLPIRDWNIVNAAYCHIKTLQFHLLPIRDWNFFI